MHLKILAFLSGVAMWLCVLSTKTVPLIFCQFMEFGLYATGIQIIIICSK